MTYEGLTKELLNRIPELRVPYRRELRQWGGDQPGQHIIFGDVLVPFIITLLQSHRGKKVLERVFDFLEELAVHPDPDVRDVVGEAVGEAFWGHDELLTRAKKYMGPKTSQVIAGAWDARFKTR